MKNFDQLNDLELVELKSEDIEKYIKLKKAEAGVKIVNYPATPEYQQIPVPDLEVFQVCGFSFTEREKAVEIAETINKHISSSLSVDYNWRGDSRVKYAKPFSGSLAQVEVEKVYSWGVYESIKEIIESNARIEKAFKALKDEYEAEEDKAKELVDEVYNKINEAKERLEKFRNYKVRIIEYLQLANGDRDVAWNFFDKAYSVEPSVKSMIMESQEYQDAIDSYIKA